MRYFTAFLLLFCCVLFYRCQGVPVRELFLSDEEVTVEPSIKPKPPAPPVCKDSPKWASECPKWAENGDCQVASKKVFMEHYCKKSCGFPCEPEPTSNPETKPPSPPGVPVRELFLSDEECADMPSYAEECERMAKVERWCTDQEKVTRVKCAKSCNWCKPTGEPTEPKPPAPAVCEDDPAYADKCPEKAAVEGYCEDQEDFMRLHCAKSCGLCAEPTEEPTEPKPPAPAVCEDNPAYADKCPEKAAVKDYCEDQEDFMRLHCAKSCGFCGEPTEKPTEPKPPAPAEPTSNPETKPPSTPEPTSNPETKPPSTPEVTVEPSTEPKPPAPAEGTDYTPYWCTLDHRSDELGERSSGESCVDLCLENNPDCIAVEWWEQGGYCYECTDPSERVPYTATGDPGYPPHVLVISKEEVTVEPSTEPKPPAPAVCEDNPRWASKCPEWAENGDCEGDVKIFMEHNCKKTCGFRCEPEVTVEPSTKPKPPAPPVCEDSPKWASECPKWAENGDCQVASKKVFMEHYCKKSCGFPCEPEPTSNPETKPPSPPAFCRDRDVNCNKWKDMGSCENPATEKTMKIYCGVTCDFCKAPTPEDCYDKIGNCAALKETGACSSTVPAMEYEVKTNCLETCEFCVPDLP